jgi:hypothetical protein
MRRPNSKQAARAPVKPPFLLALNYVHASFVTVRDRVIFIVKGDSGTMFDDLNEEDWRSLLTHLNY